MSAPPPHTHISTGRTNSELNRVAPGSTSATSGATNTSVSAGKARFQTEATAPPAVDMSTPSRGLDREAIRAGSRDIPESASTRRGASRGADQVVRQDVHPGLPHEFRCLASQHIHMQH